MKLSGTVSQQLELTHQSHNSRNSLNEFYSCLFFAQQANDLIDTIFSGGFAWL